MEPDALTAALGCQFNEWSECTVHWTEATPRGYDEPTCGVASKVRPILAARIEQARAEGAAEVVARVEAVLAEVTDPIHAGGCNYRHQQGDTDECNSCAAHAVETAALIALRGTR